MNEFVTEEQVALAYKFILNRDPDAEGMKAFCGRVGLNDLCAHLQNSLEARLIKQNLIGRMYYSYNARIDAIDILMSHEDRSRKPVPNRLVNYLGVVIDPAFLPELLVGREGEVEDVPIPANWHADLAEFAAALRAVDLANKNFRAVELGCGWGCWLLNTGVAARRRGLVVDLIGAEADAGHVDFARRGCAENGFSDTEAKIYRRVVGPRCGTALFPKQDIPGVKWGLEPILDATNDQIEAAEREGIYELVPIMTFGEICADGKMIDLVHMDIQGGEADFIDNCVEDLNKFVKYLVVGTHSRAIEGKIFETMLKNGWILEIERPALLNLNPSDPQTTIDGVQGWRNNRDLEAD